MVWKIWLIWLLKILQIYTILPQLVARICQSDASVSDYLTKIVVKTVTAFPQQALWTVLALVKSSSKERASRGIICLQKITVCHFFLSRLNFAWRLANCRDYRKRQRRQDPNYRLQIRNPWSTRVRNSPMNCCGCPPHVLRKRHQKSAYLVTWVSATELLRVV